MQNKTCQRVLLACPITLWYRNNYGKGTAECMVFISVGKTWQLCTLMLQSMDRYWTQSSWKCNQLNSTEHSTRRKVISTAQLIFKITTVYLTEHKIYRVTVQFVKSYLALLHKQPKEIQYIKVHIPVVCIKVIHDAIQQPPKWKVKPKSLTQYHTISHIWSKYFWVLNNCLP